MLKQNDLCVYSIMKQKHDDNDENEFKGLLKTIKNTIKNSFNLLTLFQIKSFYSIKKDLKKYVSTEV